MSRPEELLVLSYRTSDEEGRPAVRSAFVDDVRALFGEALDAGALVRPLAHAAWPGDSRPTQCAELAPRMPMTTPAITSAEPAIVSVVSGSCRTTLPRTIAITGTTTPM